MSEDISKLPILMFRTRTGLAPLEQIDRERIEALSWRTPIEVTVRQRRSGQNHRHLMSVLSKLVTAGACPPHETVTSLLDCLKLECGVIEIRARLDGSVFVVPGSISYAKRDEAEFKAFKEKAFSLLASTYDLPPEVFDPHYRGFVHADR